MTHAPKELVIKEKTILCIYVLLHFLGVAITFNTVVTSNDGEKPSFEPGEETAVDSKTDVMSMISFTISNLVKNMNICRHFGGRMFLWYLIFYIVLVLIGATNEGFAFQNSETDFVKIVFYIATIGFVSLAFLALIMYVNTKDEQRVTLYKRTYIFASVTLFITLAIYLLVKITEKQEEDEVVATLPAAPVASQLPAHIKVQRANALKNKKPSTKQETPQLYASASRSSAARY